MREPGAGCSRLKDESLTWGEFKKFLDERGVKDDEPLFHINVSYPKANLLMVYIDKDRGLVVE